ncbi:MAG: lipid-A-disaccharide synthase [Prevotella sp.]|nr:lipid-A-disaccharide synthase [Prevotella sp.]
MRYYMIAGEASGDLHASRLAEALRRHDPAAELRGFGGNLMAQAGCQIVKHYSELAFMGIGPVLRHLPQIVAGMRLAQRDIVQWQPNVVILIDYPGFNMRMARFVHKHTDIPVAYYIAPKIWAWKEWRIRSIRRYVDLMLSILPFEVDFFEGKHHYHVNYVGNPTADEVRQYLNSHTPQLHNSTTPRLHDSTTPQLHNSSTPQRIIALLPGSRRQEIRANLPAMLRAVATMAGDYRLVVAGAPSVSEEFYRRLIDDTRASAGSSCPSAGSATRPEILFNQSFDLLRQAHAALVTSGTATLETALLGVPQVVCYATPLPRLVALLRRWVLKVRWVSLVNLIAQREVVPELVADTFSAENMRKRLSPLLHPDSAERLAMLQGYRDVWQRLGNNTAPDEAAKQIINLTTLNMEH